MVEMKEKMHLWLISSLILVASYVECVQIVFGDNTGVLSRLEEEYRLALGHSLRYPNITSISVTPKNASVQEVLGIRQCFKPISFSGRPDDTCYERVWVCEKYYLQKFEKFDFITTNYTFSGESSTRYAPNRCVERRTLPDIGEALVSEKGVTCNNLDSDAGNGRFRFSSTTFQNIWSDGTSTSAVSGTISFRVHLTLKNLYQHGSTNKCASDLQLYGYKSQLTLDLKCNEEKTNMDLYLNDKYNSDSSVTLLKSSVLNDDSVTFSNSLHIAHLIDIVNSKMALYVNGEMVFSSSSFTPMDNIELYDYAASTSGTLFDFKVYRLPLSLRLINEIYHQRNIIVNPATECYCPLDHGIFYPPNATQQQTWTGDTCTDIGNFSRVKPTSRPALSVKSVKRIPDISNGTSNLLRVDQSADYWISAATGHAVITAPFKKFYVVLVVVLRVLTLPDTLTVTLNQRPVLQYKKTCSSAQENVVCLEWNSLTIYEDLVIIRLNDSVDFHKLRSDRVEITLDGYFKYRQPYVMKGLEVYADCGCLAERGRCVVSGSDRSEYGCICKEEYSGTYCELCLDNYTSNGTSCIPCDCNRDGSVDQNCDKLTGQCNCVNTPMQSFGGVKCDPYVDEIRPSYGPIAGGTVVTLQGQLLDQIVNVTIGAVNCKLNHEGTRTSTEMTCVTGEAPIDVIHNVTNLSLTIEKPRSNQNLITYFAKATFEYHRNPNITSVNRVATFYSGGLKMEFGGTDLQAIHSPRMVLNIECTQNPGVTVNTSTLACKMDGVTIKKYLCELPSFNKLANITDQCLPTAGRSKRRVTDMVQDSQHFRVWPGLKLDGFKDFTNLSTSEWLPTGPLQVFPDPVIFNFTDPGQIRVLESVDGGDITVDLGGSNLNLSATLSDFLVTIGPNSKPTCIKLSETALTCRMRSALPTPFPDAPKFGPSNEPVPLVQVEVGNLVFHPGYVYIEKLGRPAWETPVIVVIVILTLCIVAAVALFIYRKRMIEVRRKESRAAMMELEAFEATNSLQTQVQSILIEENLNEPLLQHIIPASFITQDNIIGQGHFGQVYKGKLYVPEKNINKSVAIKCLKPAGLTAEDVANFVKEALLMKDFNHINVLQLVGIVYEPADVEGLPQVVTPLMEKGDLKSLVSDEFYEFSAGDLLHFGLQVAGGMAYLSESKYIHRDLRAANCMVDSTFIVKIGDFGLSHDISESDYYRPQDKSKPLPVKWMALEVLSERSKYTTQSDVWSFGVLLWELMTRGYQPYADIPNSQIKNHILNGRRLDKPEFIPDVVYDVMTSCWVVEPDCRPTFDELTKTISDMLKQADGSGYQKNYTTPLASVDYMNPQTIENTGLDDWSAIIPLIKGFGQDYADNGRVGDDEDSDDSEPEEGAGPSYTLTHPQANQTESLNQQLNRMNAGTLKTNDYIQGTMSSNGPRELEVVITRPDPSSASSDRPPPVPTRPTAEDLSEDWLNTPPRRRQILSSESTIEGQTFHDSSDSGNSMERPPRSRNVDLSPMAFINNICDSLPTPSLESLSVEKETIKLPAQPKLSGMSSSSESVTYEEAIEVKKPMSLDQPVPAKEALTNTTFAPDGYLEFETIQADKKQEQKPKEKKTEPKRPPPLKVQHSSISLGGNDEKKPFSGKRPISKSISNNLSGRSMMSPTTPTKLSLLTKVPARSSSNDSSLNKVGYEEPCSVWRKPGQKGHKKTSSPSVSSPTTATTKSTISVSSPVPLNDQPNTTATVAADGYLEFDLIGEENSDSKPTEPEPAPETKTLALSATSGSKKKTLDRQDSFEELSPPASPTTVKEDSGASYEPMEAPKPVARVIPMTRTDYDMVIPPPARLRNSEPANVSNNELYLNQAAANSGTDYINLAVRKQPNLVLDHSKGLKPPVPQVRYSAQTKGSSGLTVDMGSDSGRPKSAATGRSELNSLVPSPNTRRRNIQESLNAQVLMEMPHFGSEASSSNAEDTPARDPEYENASAYLIYDRPYENAQMFQQRKVKK